MKKETKCLHLNTTQVGTETTAEVWCVDCNECIRTYPVPNYIKGGIHKGAYAIVGENGRELIIK